MAKRFRVTYATLSADNEDLQAAYDEGVRVARSWFGETLPGYGSHAPVAPPSRL
jgi:1-pyrroline-5-carboxylate dehydrogenase